MANAVHDAPMISWEEYLALEWPHEWVGGAAYAMGATLPRHAQICARRARQLPDRGPCTAYAASLVVYVAELDRGFLPDLVVICGSPVEAPGKPGAIMQVSAGGKGRGHARAASRAAPGSRCPVMAASVAIARDGCPVIFRS